MAIDAVAGISTCAQPGAARAAGSCTTESLLRLDTVGSSEAADTFRETMNRVHDEVTKFKSDAGQNAVPSDPVEAVRQSILPSPWKAAPLNGVAAGPAGAAAAAPAGGANEVLRKSFDHALSITLVSQVMSGLSQATSTLIRQQ